MSLWYNVQSDLIVAPALFADLSLVLNEVPADPVGVQDQPLLAWPRSSSSVSPVTAKR